MELADRCNNRDPLAQREVYDRYASKMMSVCYRYARSKDEAEDYLQDGFIRVFDYLHQYKCNGSFEGWIRRVFVTTCINHTRTRHRELEVDELDDYHQQTIGDGFEDYTTKYEIKELLQMVQELPDQYKTVFNLYVIDGYNHNEIAEMLQISVGSSKSNLSRARGILVKKITQKEHYIHGTVR
ncbi:MAG: sigma-70 family RNA polymerase sigma factor [Bacteroidetes bacterium]|nr:sigma-70 family RNA polymerase sigma factor [Bacteroidota bacterium]